MFNQCKTSILLSAIMDSSSKKTRKKNYTVLKDKTRISPELTYIIYQSQAAIQSLEEGRENSDLSIAERNVATTIPLLNYNDKDSLDPLSKIFSFKSPKQLHFLQCYALMETTWNYTWSSQI